MSFAAGSSPFVGRSDQLAALRQWHDDAARGDPRVVVVQGAAGLGKSELVTHFLSMAARSGSRVLLGAAQPESRIPFLPVVSALMPAATSIDDPSARHFSRLLRGTPGDASPIDAHASPELMLFLAVSEMLASLGRRQMTVLAIDDLHWADPSTVDLVAHLVGDLGRGRARPEPTKLLLLLAARPTASKSQVGQLLGRFRHEPQVRNIELVPFGELDTNDLLRSLGPGRPAPRLLDPLRRATGGNPLLLRTLWRRLLGEGELVLEGDVVVSRRGTASLPHGLVDLDHELTTQLEAAPAELRSVLAVLAILGGTASVDLLAAAARRSAADIEALVGSRAGQELLELRRQDVSFLHPEMTVVCLSMLQGQERQLLHAQMLELRIGRTTPEAPEEGALDVLDHVLGAGPFLGEDQRAELGLAAGARAMGLGAWPTAAAAFDAAVDAMSGDDPRRDEAQWRAAVTNFRNHDRLACERHALACIQGARVRGDLPRWGEALELLTRVRVTVAQSAGAVLNDRPLLEFLEAAGDRAPRQRAKIACALADQRFVRSDFDGGLEWTRRARRIASSSSDEELHALAAFAEGLQRLGRVEVQEAEQCFRETIEHADQLPDRWLRAWGRGRLALVLWAQGRFAEAWAAAHEAIATAEANHDWAEQSIAHAAAAGLATTEGRFEAAERHGDDSLRTFARSGYAFTPRTLFPILSTGRALRGNRDGAAVVLDLWRATGATGLPAAFELFVASAVGDVDAARHLFFERPWRSPAEARTDLGTVAFAAGYIDVAESLGDPLLARAVTPVLEVAVARGMHHCLTSVSPVRQLLATAHRLDGDVERSSALLDEVERDLERAPSRLVAARVAYDRALIAAMLGDGRSAGAMAAEAAARFDELGALPGLARSDALRRRVTGGSLAPSRRTRVILVTDLVESTVLNVVVGDDRFVELLGEHDRAVRTLLGQHGGVAFKHTGDGFAAWFDHGDAANRCALAIQPVLDDLSLGHPSQRLRVRCGLAAGEPLDQDGDLFGLAVVRAARVCGRAGPGDVLAADEVIALSPMALYEPHGLTQLKGLPDPVMIHRAVRS